MLYAAHQQTWPFLTWMKLINFCDTTKLEEWFSITMIALLNRLTAKELKKWLPVICDHSHVHVLFGRHRTCALLLTVNRRGTCAPDTPTVKGESSNGRENKGHQVNLVRRAQSSLSVGLGDTLSNVETFATVLVFYSFSGFGCSIIRSLYAMKIRGCLDWTGLWKRAVAALLTWTLSVRFTCLTSPCFDHNYQILFRLWHASGVILRS